MLHSVPDVSVCMPVYNGSAYIAASIESVLAQTYKGLQLIVSDNCSTDNTGEIAQRFRDPRMCYVRNSTNLGPVGNFNRCIELAQGKYVCIFHHDDVMMPDNLEQKVRLLEKHSEIGFVHSNLVLIGPKGEVVAPDIWAPDSRRDYIEKGKTVFLRYLDYLPWGSSIFIGTVVARRSCYDRLGGFRTELSHGNDVEMLMRMLLFYDVACLGKPLVKYRVHESSASSAFGDYRSISYMREHFSAVDMIFKEYGDRIPDRKRLERHTNRAFAERCLSLAHQAFSERDLGRKNEFVRQAVSFYPGIKSTVVFWKMGLKFAAGGCLRRIGILGGQG
jgi:glycosyltransferase involved in cell wall biosynthesis